MKKFLLKLTALSLIVLYIISMFTISVSQASAYTNSKGTVKVVCGRYSKKFKAKKFGKNFSKAFNAALETARKKASSSTPAVVTVSKGKYKLDRTLKVYSNTVIKADNCTFKYYGNLLRNGYNGKASAASGYKGASNITIDGGIWDAAVPYSQAGTANWRIQHSTLRFAHSNGITIKNCVFRNNYNCHDIELGGVNNAIITNCKFYNDKAVNTFKNDGGREAIQLDVNTSAAMPEFGRFDNTPCKNITLSYCSFKNKFRAIGSHHAVLGNPFKNISVHHNYFRNIGGITVYGVYWTNSQIYSNTMEYVGLGVDMRNMTIGSGYNFYNSKNLSYKQCENAVKKSKLYIYDNKITLRKKNNIYARACGIRVMGEYYAKKNKKTNIKAGAYKVYNVNIGVAPDKSYKANTIKGNVAAGIQLNYAVNSVVTNNSVNAFGSVSETSNGIEIKGCENATVNLNTVINGNREEARGIYLTPTAAGFGNKNTIINNNTVSNFSNSGVYVYSSDNSKIFNNTVNNCGNMGVSVRSSRNTLVDNNSLSGIKTSSINVYSGSVNTTLLGNSINKSEKTGIRIRQSNSTKLNNNDIIDCGEYGVLIRGSSDTEMIQNTISESQSNGVRVNYGSDNTVLYNNSIVSPNAECVYLNGSNDTTKHIEKSLEVSNNYLNTSSNKAAVAVTKDNIAAKVYSNFRNDGKDLFYGFKGDDEENYTKIKEPIKLEDLTINRFDDYNLLNWNFMGDDVYYRVYREDESGTKLISDTPEHFCMDNDLFFKSDNTQETTSPDKETTSQKAKIISYSVSPYKAFSNVKYIGEPVSVDFE